MTAAAHQPVDEPIDREEGPMPAADFRIIERAHEICDHAPARELSADLGNSELSNAAHASLLPRAIKILGAQIRARELVAEMKERGELSDQYSTICRICPGDDETDEPPVTDWRQIAADAWDAPSWKDAAVDYRTSARMRR
jgi:hypothetical protein